MRIRKNKKARIIAILSILAFFISVGYAALQTNLFVTSTAVIKKQSFNVYYSNVQTTTGSVTPTTAPTTSGTSTTQLSWTVSMDTPGQFYEFTVDVTNSGTLDAMISDVINTTLTPEQAQYLTYTVTYDDYIAIQQYDKLEANETESIRIRLEVKQDAQPSDIPNNPQITLNLGAIYGIADSNATARTKAPRYTITFDKNSASATGTMADQKILYDRTANLNANAFTLANYTFKEWNTASNGSGTAYTDGQSVTNIGDTTLYAQWELKVEVKYAVQIYGIYQDVAADGTTPLGLTFGPATGADYNNAYVTHTYEEIEENPGNYYVKIVTHPVNADGTEGTSTEEYLTNSNGDNVIRTTAEKNKYDVNMHEMTWTQIAAVSDKTVFEDCMLCGDTKSVSLTLNSTIRTGNIYNQYGDGAGTLYNTINKYYARWSPSSPGLNVRNAGGYSASHIRATLIGKNAKTNEEYAGNANLSENTCLYNCIEDDLQAVITPKKIKYVTGESTSNYTVNDDIADSIWLFSDREMYGTGQQCGQTAEGIGSSGVGYARFSNLESKYYIASYNLSKNSKRVVYHESGSAYYWWLRSPWLNQTNLVGRVYNNGTITNDYASSYHGLSFGFCIQ